MRRVAAPRDLRRSVRAQLRAGPVVLPATLAAGVLVFLAVSDGGYAATKWYPAALVVLALLALGLVVLPGAGGPPGLVLSAAGLLGGYAVWSYASIAWAQQNADAWDGANRTALYAIVFALFALWPLGRRGAAFLTAGIALAIAAVGVVALVRVNAATGTALVESFLDGRLAWPIKYHNATVCLWFLGFWPCVAFAARREVHPLLRGLFLGAAVLLMGLALLGQSRGWFFAAPAVLVLFLAISPGRVRLAWTLAIVGLLTLIPWGPALDVHKQIVDGVSPDRPFADATVAIATATVLAIVAGAAAGYLERRVSVPEPVGRRTGQAMLAAVVLAAVVGLVVFTVRVDSPIGWVGDRWAEFKGGADPSGHGARFTQGLGSNRFDFWRVGWEDFEGHPLTGVGADNFRHDYLLHRKSLEEPYYPHSGLIRVFGQTGLVGALLLFGGMACAVLAALRAIRGRLGIGAVTAAAATTSWAYFMVHGAVDWFWELSALGVAAFAMLGVAAGLMPRPAVLPLSRAAQEPLVRSPAALAVATVVAGLLVAGFAAPWLSARDTLRAHDVFTRDPRQAPEALRLLDRAAGLNPWSTAPRFEEAQIGLALGNEALAREGYQAVLERDPRDMYSNLALATLASMAGDRAQALRYARRARDLSPRDPLAEAILGDLGRGKRVDIQMLRSDFQTRREARGK
jgi:hypothetical protein